MTQKEVETRFVRTRAVELALEANRDDKAPGVGYLIETAKAIEQYITTGDCDESREPK